jgi:hypothetical protein
MPLELPPKTLRRLAFTLGEVEQLLRSARRRDIADALAKLVGSNSTMAAEDFVMEGRSILESALLGERDLTTELIGAILDALNEVDNLLREANKIS